MTELLDITKVDAKTLMGSSRADLIKLAQDLQSLKQQAGQVGPQTDDQLHKLIKDRWGIHVPRVAVDTDRGHCAPFDMIADVYFERITAGLAVGGRESGKTFNVAIIHALNARFKPGYEGISAGAVAEQSKRAYAALKKLNRMWGGQDAETKEKQVKEQTSDVESSLQSETLYTNGSTVSILGGTVAQLNGPHSNLLHRDEVELFRRDAFDEANNITRTGQTFDGRPIKAVDLLTSSLKYAKGLLQEILARVDEAVAKGNEPPYKVYRWGVAETIAPVTNCRNDPKNAGRPESELCPCNTVVNGVWPVDNGPGIDRSLQDVCAGRKSAKVLGNDHRFARGDGYRPLEPDIVNKFLQNSKIVWEAQQECIKPAAEGLILENFAKERHGIRYYMPDPENGPIFNSTDFGGTNAHASNWYQLTTRMVNVTSYDGDWMVIPAGALVCFDEIYVTEIGNVALADMVVAREQSWKNSFPYWLVIERYADIAAKAARLDWRSHSTPLPTVWRITREVDEHIQKCINLVDNMKFYVDVGRCPMFVSEAEAWQKDPETGKQLDEFNHCFPAGTLVSTPDGEVAIEDVAPGLVVSTAQGDCVVTAAGITQFDQDVYEILFEDGSTLRATANHPCWVDGKGWTAVSDMRYTDRVWKLHQNRSPEERPSSSHSEGYGSDDTQAPKTSHHASTTGRGSKKRISVSNLSIARSGRQLTEIYRRVARSITQTSIPSTMISRILNASLFKSIARHTVGSLVVSVGAITLTGFGQRVSLPTFSIPASDRRRWLEARDFTMHSKRTPQRGSASSAEASSLTLLSTGEQSSVADHASQLIAGRRASTMNADRVRFATPSSSSTDTRRSDHALVAVVSISHVSREDVYDLTIDGAHEFYADGVRAHNSMSNFRYAVANIDRKYMIQQLRGSNDQPAAADPDQKKPADRHDLGTLPTTGPASRTLHDMPSGIPMHHGASAYDVRI